MFKVAECKVITHEEVVAVAVMNTNDIDHVHLVSNWPLLADKQLPQYVIMSAEITSIFS